MRLTNRINAAAGGVAGLEQTHFFHFFVDKECNLLYKYVVIQLFIIVKYCVTTTNEGE
jgi:hypothetical protein